MARALSQLTPISMVIVIIIFLIQQQLAYASDNLSSPLIILRPPHSQARPAFVLPLHRSSSAPNSSSSSSSSSSSNPHRFLQRSGSPSRPNARMRLYDDLLLNGYYTTRLWIGTPPQRFALIVDTGSTVTYVPCSTCDQCGNHQDPKFDPELSSTYQPVKCNIDCTCDNEREQCVYERQYAEMSTSSGVLGEDLLSFGNLSELAPHRAVFGCENVETGDLYSQHADGIMGLGRGDLSVVDQLVDKGVIGDSFSLCYGGMDIGGGAMVLGDISPPSDMVFAHSDPVRSPYYNIDLKEIHVAGKPLSLNPRVFDGKHGTVLDSGTTYAYLPESAFVAFKDAMMKELHSFKQIRGPDPNYNDICFTGAGRNVSQLSNIFPAVDMVFSGGQKLSLSPENYLFRHSKARGAYCLGIFQNGKDPTTLLGGIVVRNTLVMYDREHSKIGFWKTNCSELWERLQISTSSPTLSPASNEKNSTMAVPPTLAPNEAPPHVVPENLQIGQITVDMSLNMSYEELKPHATELTKYIAHGLDVNVSQVHLLNFNSSGNNSFIRWAIVPADSAGYISNTTAMTIIGQLTEHHLELPAAFGDYELIGWSVEPKEKRTWWRQNYLVVIVAFFVALVTGLSTFGLWFIWRRRQQTVNAYKPVDEVIPEQELQPLNF
ncbi:aspartic proteinase CDR1 [Ziziphus jujuba]|uniref:Aspartic proteinase CDR1 n=1 Tax=Ziziphus jujuba TaxID=326968 RepID=A0A6P4AS53_ZIZJJ|nr:aspartic proteinase CDR1 [Ziziphus jujuba]